MKTRLLMITNGHPERCTGGCEIISYEVFQSLHERRHLDVTLLARDYKPAYPSREVTPFTTLRQEPQEILWSQPPFDFFSSRTLDPREITESFRRLLETLQPDVVHLQHTIGLGYDVIWQIKNSLPKTPLVYTLHEFLPICHRLGHMVKNTGELCTKADPGSCHGCFPDIPPQQFVLRTLRARSAFRLVDRFLVPSQFLRDRYLEWGIPQDKIEYQPAGRSLAPPSAKFCETTPATNTFGFFGQMRPNKGVTVLLEAVTKIKQRGGTPIKVFINGSSLEDETPEYQSRVRHLLEACGDWVEDLGAYQRDELEARMARVAWVVVPSIWWENSPLVIEEAFHYDRPVLCGNVGGMAEKVEHDANGLHFEIGNPYSLAQTLQRAASTRGLWRHLRSQVVKSPPTAQMAQGLERTYAQLLQEDTHASGRKLAVL